MIDEIREGGSENSKKQNTVTLNEGRLRKKAPQKHLRWTMDGPASSYSCLLIHICWKVESEARMEPPIQTEYLRSGGAIICREKKNLLVNSEAPSNMLERFTEKHIRY